jgi:hypothetical protein
MLYWLGVYLLVALSVAIPFLLLYFVGILFWLAFTAIRSASRTLRDTLAFRRDLGRAHWTVIRRKAA